MAALISLQQSFLGSSSLIYSQGYEIWSILLCLLQYFDIGILVILYFASILLPLAWYSSIALLLLILFSLYLNFKFVLLHMYIIIICLILFGLWRFILGDENLEFEGMLDSIMLLFWSWRLFTLWDQPRDLKVCLIILCFYHLI